MKCNFAIFRCWIIRGNVVSLQKQISQDMDYTTIPRKLIYKERRSLEDFDIDDESPLKIDPLFYNRLITIDYLNPRNEGSFDEILRIFNDVYYITTMIFLEKRPLERYAQYRKIALKRLVEQDSHSEERLMVELCMLFIILKPFNVAKQLPQPHVNLLNIIADELNRYSQNNDTFVMLARLRGEQEDIVYKMTRDLDNYHLFMNYKTDFARRDIQELINNEESLKDCLCYGKELRKAVEFLCENKEQKLSLIHRLLEPIKEKYGFLDARVCDAYKSLFELQSELTGETLPNVLPFEQISTPPLAPTYASIQNHQAEKDSDDKSYGKLKKDLKLARTRISELEKENGLLKEENEELKKQGNLIGDNQQGFDAPHRYIESLNRQLAEEKNKNAQLEANVKQLRENLELDKIMESDTLRLQIDERIILITTALGTPWNSDLTNQTQLAKIIEHFSGDEWRSIRTRIVAINGEMKKETNTPGEGLSQGTKEAISNVIGWLEKATRGDQNTLSTDKLIKEIKDVFLNTKE